MQERKEEMNIRSIFFAAGIQARPIGGVWVCKPIVGIKNFPHIKRILQLTGDMPSVGKAIVRELNNGFSDAFGLRVNCICHNLGIQNFKVII